jgi:hypothetical protein
VRSRGVRETTHTRHHTQNVVVNCIYADLGRARGVHGVVRNREEERGVVDTRHVARARWLVGLWVQCKAVHVDTRGGDVRVVLEWLYQVVVATEALYCTILTVQLELGRDDGVATSRTLAHTDEDTTVAGRAVEPVSVVEWLLTLECLNRGVIANERVTLDDPDQLLNWVVKVELDLVHRGRDRLVTRELQLLNELLVGLLGMAAALLSIEHDVVNVQRCRNETGSCNTRLYSRRVGVDHVAELVKLEVDANLVVLEGDQGEGQTSVTVEPELEWDIEGVLRGALAGGVGVIRAIAVGGAVVLAINTRLNEQVDELGNVADHLLITELLAGFEGELVPDVQPITVVLVDALTTDLDLNRLNEVVAGVVQPAEFRTRTIRRLELNLGEGGLEIHVLNHITVTGDGARYTLSKVCRAVEGLLNGLHREVGVAAVYNLEKGNLWLASQVNILGAISDKLHQCSGHFISVFLNLRKR